MQRPHRITGALILAVFGLLNLHSAAVIGGERRSVVSNIANIRSGPGGNFDIIWKVEKYHPLLIVEESGNWFRFRDFENDEGWIHRSLLGTVPTIITRQAPCNIRSGPGTQNKILFTVDAGIPFRILQTRGNWLQIEHADGDRGWIHQSLVW